MSDSSGPIQRGRERFVRGAPAHLEALRRVRAELKTNPVEARGALLRVSGFIAREAELSGLESVARKARRVSEDEVAAPTAIAALEAALEELVAGISTARILIVEDDPASALLARTALEGEGRTLDVAATAAEARRALAAHPADLMVLDLVLPDADGRHLLMELSRDLDSASTAVVVVTAKGTPATRAECFAYGARAFLEKPIDVNALRSVASDVLAIDTARREDDTAPIDPPDRVRVRDAFLRMRSLLEAGVPMVLALVDVDPSQRGWDEDGRMPAELTDQYRRVAAALQESLQPGDVMRRWGVSEIVVLFQGREAEACVRVLERAQARVGSQERAFFAGVTAVQDGALFEDAISWASRLASEARLSEDAGILRTTLAKSRAPFALVVEDDPITASLLKHRLERSGFEVEHHDNGLRGLEAIRRTLPDLVILDIRLPGMDGFEILSRMKAEGVTKNVRTIVLTGLGRESDVSRAFGLGADDYIVKPFSPVELTARALRLVRP